MTIPPPPYGAGEPPPPEPPPDPPPGPRVRYDDDGGLAYPPGAGEAPEREARYEDDGRPDAYGAAPPDDPGPRRVPAMPSASFAEDPPGPLERLRNLVSGDELDPGRPGLRMLVVVGVIAALVAGWYWWHARPHEQPLAAPSPVRPVAASPQPPPGTPAPMTSGGSPAGASPSATAVVVDVAGKVRHPGVVHLPPGSRVIDAIQAAGGAKPGAPLTSLNLARVLVDGEQIVVGTSAVPTAGAVPPPGASPGVSSGATVSLNTATSDQLEALPGIGPALAKRILDYRTQHGGFRSVDELQDVSGIGPKRFADLKSQVTL